MPLAVAVLVVGSAVIAVMIQTCSDVPQRLMNLESYMTREIRETGGGLSKAGI